MQSSFSPFPQNFHLTAPIVTFHQQWHRNVELRFLVLCPTCLLPLTLHPNDTAIKSLIKTLYISAQQTALHSLSVCQAVVWTHSKCSSSRVLRVGQINRLKNRILVSGIKGFSSYSTGNTLRVCYELSGQDVQLLCWVRDICAVKGNVVTVRAMRTYRGSLTSALAAGECVYFTSRALYLGRAPETVWTILRRNNLLLLAALEPRPVQFKA